MKITLIKCRSLLVMIFGLLCLNVQAQFNENLEKKILALAKDPGLDGIERASALDRLAEVSPRIENADFVKNLTGEVWKYSHSVDASGRKYRRSNAVYIYQFDENGDAYFLPKNSQAKTWCQWNYDYTEFFQIERFSSKERTESTRTDYFGVHHISSDRLVFTSIVRSKDYQGKSAILFNVYFRR